MKKVIYIFALMNFCSVSYSQSDSMLVIWRSNEATVQIREQSTGHKLKDFIRNVGRGDGFTIRSLNEDIFLQCSSIPGIQTASCTIKFQPSFEVIFDSNKILATSISENTQEFRIQGTAAVSFQNNQGDFFSIHLDANKFQAELKKSNSTPAPDES